MSITFAITVHDELVELTSLINFLLPKLLSDDEILVQYDTDSTTDAVKQYLEVIQGFHPTQINVINFPLNNDFSAFKNNLKEHSKGLYIFQLDADETIAEYLIDNLHTILESNNDVDLFCIPRVNTVDGLTMKHVAAWGWPITKFDNIVDEREVSREELGLLRQYDLVISETDNLVKFYKPVNCWPDCQQRLFKRTSEIHWINSVHEVINGYNSLTVLPLDIDYSLFHSKKISRQEQQNSLYDTIK